MLEQRKELGIIGQVRELHMSPGHEAAAGRFEATVAICFANAREVLPDMIRSLREQEGAPPFELLLVSNATTDDTVAVALREASGMPVRVVECESAGYDSNGRNVSVQEAAAEKVLFLDSDDAVDRRYVAAMSAALDTHPLVTGSWVVGARGDGLPDLGEGMVVPLPFDHQGWTYAPAGTLGMRRTVPAEIGGFDPALAYTANNEWCFRAYASGYPITTVPGALVRYRMRGTAAAAFRQRFRWGMLSVAASKAASAYGLPRKRGLRRFGAYWRLAKAMLRRRDWRDFAGLLGQTAGHAVGAVRFRHFDLG
jgi:GT2 family glycosyltransferase